MQLCFSSETCKIKYCIWRLTFAEQKLTCDDVVVVFLSSFLEQKYGTKRLSSNNQVHSASPLKIRVGKTAEHLELTINPNGRLVASPTKKQIAVGGCSLGFSIKICRVNRFTVLTQSRTYQLVWQLRPCHENNIRIH